MTHKIILKTLTILLLTLSISGCSNPWSKSTDKYFRKAAPHFMKWQMYKGVPTPYNQFSQDEYGDFASR